MPGKGMSSGQKELVVVQPKLDTPKLDRNRGTLPPLGLAYVTAYKTLVEIAQSMM